MTCHRCHRSLKNDPHPHCGGCYEELLQRANGIVRENYELTAEVARLESVRQSLIVERNGEAAAAMKWKGEAVRLVEELRLANDFIRQQREKTLEELAAKVQALKMGD